MLSFTRGKEIAKLTNKDGKKTIKTIRLYGADDFSTKTESDIIIPKKEYSQLLTNDFFKSNKISKGKQQTLKDIVNGDKSRDNMSDEMSEYVESADDEIKKLLKTQLIFSGENDDKRCFPIPQKKSERIYVPAPSGSGKSTFIGLYLKELRAKYKKRPIYIFSRVEDKPLVKYIRNFRDDVLETGRHYDITIISTSHIITNFLATRTLINEANAIVLFPKGSSFYAVSNFLERYMGFSKAQIRMVEKLETRWIWFWKEYPKYAIHERGAFIF